MAGASDAGAAAAMQAVVQARGLVSLPPGHPDRACAGRYRTYVGSGSMDSLGEAASYGSGDSTRSAGARRPSGRHLQLARRSAARVTAGQYLAIMASQNSGSGMALTDSGASMCRLVAIWKEH